MTDAAKVCDHVTRYLHGQRQSYGIPLLSDAWGSFDYYLEIDNQHVTRQVNVFENGDILRYTREHWCDDYGMMFIGTFSLKQKAARGRHPIDQKEFEKVWRRSLESSNWINQRSTAKMAQWGTWSERVGANQSRDT